MQFAITLEYIDNLHEDTYFVIHIQFSLLLVDFCITSENVVFFIFVYVATISRLLQFIDSPQFCDYTKIPETKATVLGNISCILFFIKDTVFSLFSAPV